MEHLVSPPTTSECPPQESKFVRFDLHNSQKEVLEVATFPKICMSKRKNRVPWGVGGGRRQVHPSGSANASERRVCEMASDLITTVYCAFYFTKNNQFICKTNQILTKNVVCIIAIRFTQLHLCTSFQFIFLEFIIHKIVTILLRKNVGPTYVQSTPVNVDEDFWSNLMGDEI